MEGTFLFSCVVTASHCLSLCDSYASCAPLAVTLCRLEDINFSRRLSDALIEVFFFVFFFLFFFNFIFIYLFIFIIIIYLFHVIFFSPNLGSKFN
jgi:hypothetical protein